MSTQLNPTATNERLMLLKGKRDDLATIDINPGAIYFTTDYPGIYVDFAAEGNTPAKRVRMGDVTVVDTLSSLKDLAANAITDGQKLGKNTLYYAKDKNVLCIYDEDENKFVWINDTSSLETRMGTAETSITQQGTKIGNIEAAIGSKTANHAATKDKTIYAAIETEYTRATNAEEAIRSDLQSQIDGLKGNGDGSIGDLQEQINALTKTHTDYETNTNNTLSEMKGTNWGEGTNGKPSLMGNAANIAGHETRIDAIEGRLSEVTDDDYKNVIEDITVTINGSAAPSVLINDDKVAAITLPKDLSKYDGSGTITSINTAISKVKNGGATSGKTWTEAMNLYDHSITLGNHETRLGTAESKLSGIEAGAEVNEIESISVKINGSATELAAKNGTAITVTLPKNLNDYDGTGVITSIQNTITDDVKGDGWGSDNNNIGSPTLASNKAAINAINTKLGENFESNAQVNRIETIAVATGTPTSSATISQKQATITVPGALAHLSDGGRVGSLETGVGNINQAIGSKTTDHTATKDKTIYKAIEDEYTRATSAEQSIRDLINTSFATADAMTFKGAIGFMPNGISPNLPTGAKAANAAPVINAGDTWVLSVNNENTTGTYHAGDLFIAIRDQGAAETSYPSGIVAAGGNPGTSDGWYHVKTGYDGVHEAKLSVVADQNSGTTKTGNKIALTSHVGTALGSVEFTTSSTNIAIGKNPGENGSISINLVWSTF